MGFIHVMLSKGGDTIWGDLDWSPEGGYDCSMKKQKNNGSQAEPQDGKESLDARKKPVHYGRIISFGKDVAEMHSSDINRMDFRGAIKGNNLANSTCQDVWTEYHDMGVEGIKAVADYKTYTAGSILSAELCSTKDDKTLPNAPEMEIYSLYGVGVPTEQAYVYKSTPATDCYIPFQIDTSEDGGTEESCLKGGVYSVDGDETVQPIFLREEEPKAVAMLIIMGNFALIVDVIRIAAGATGDDLRGDVHSEIFEWSERIKLKL
ncbi:Phospholipid:diacylglycerol acyltransferase 1-like protein [Drosera capensis]